MLLQVENGIVAPGSALNPIENDKIPHKDNLAEGKGGNGRIPQKTNLKALRPEGMLPQVENGIVLQRSDLNQIENDMIPPKNNLTEEKEGNGKIPQKMNLRVLRPEGTVPQVNNGIVLLRNQIENNMIPHKDNLMEGKEGKGKIPLMTNLKLKGMLMNLEGNEGNGKIPQTMMSKMNLK